MGALRLRKPPVSLRCCLPLLCALAVPSAFASSVDLPALIECRQAVAEQAALAPLLVAQGIDTLLMIGCSTSGCIRASAVDAVQHGFRAMVVRECVGDRHPGPHEANLFDIDSKYGDVVHKREALDYLNRL